MKKLEYIKNVLVMDWILLKMAVENDYPYTYNILKIIKNQFVIWYYKIVNLCHF